MGNPPRPHQQTSSQTAVAPPPPPPPASHGVTLIQPCPKKKHKPIKVFRVFRNVLRSFPIITPAACKLPSLPGGRLPDALKSTTGSNGGTRVTGTLFGYRKGRVSFSIQENPRTLPMLVVELPIQTQTLQKEMSGGLLRIAMECEKRSEKDKIRLIDEPMWSVFSNGKKNGYGRREATEEDLHVMEVLKAVSMGAGVLPLAAEEGAEDGAGEMAYARGHFERVVGSRDSETLYMLSPDGSNAPDLSIFFVRI